MIVLKDYQAKAVSALLEHAFDILLMAGQRRQKIVFKAPTGAGKTVIMADLMRRVAAQMPERAAGYPRPNVAYIWLAPNKLHQQSLAAFRAFFAETRDLRPVEFQDIDQHLTPGDVLFLNWQSVNKDSNVFMRDNEQARTLKRYLMQTLGAGIELVAVLDEAHLFASKGQKAQEFLDLMQAKIEIDVSATPLFKSDYQVVIQRQKVVDAHMIKEQILLNPGLSADDQDALGGVSLDEVLLTKALARRVALREAYLAEGERINPLLLIQLPNDSATIDSADVQVRDEVLTWLDAQHGINVQNGRLAIWLSDGKDKVNLDGITASDNAVEVLLFKQAIALGWDCPRAGVLLIYRKLNALAFTIQTVGRILRMPQQRYYANKLLNTGYVYTDLSRDQISVVADSQDYLVLNRAVRSTDYAALNLPSDYIEIRTDRNRLGSKFRRSAEATAETWFGWDTGKGRAAEDWYADNRARLGESMVQTSVDDIEIPVPTDVVLSGEIETVVVSHVERFAKTSGELRTLFRAFCRQNVGGYGPAESVPVLEGALLHLFEKYLGYSAGSGEVRAMKTMLYEPNRPHFADLCEQARAHYGQVMAEEAAKKDRQVECYAWDVPPERAYNERYVARVAPAHALQPFFQEETASNPEVWFRDFLNAEAEHIAWWYKNGERTKADFALTYENTDGRLALFYVDYVIWLKSGTLCLFDTKTPGSEREFVAKHNALVGYLETLRQDRDKSCIGGVLVPDTTGGTRRWKYADCRIDSSRDTRGWVSFYPGSV